jgi:hypothetical protein
VRTAEEGENVTDADFALLCGTGFFVKLPGVTKCYRRGGGVPAPRAVKNEPVSVVSYVAEDVWGN